MQNPQRITRMLFTGVLVLLAVVVAWLLYVRSVENPWTRDGQVQAEVVKIAPQVSAPCSRSQYGTTRPFARVICSSRSIRRLFS